MFDRLPNEIKTIIFRYLTHLKDIINLSQINKQTYLFYKGNDVITYPDINLFQLPLIGYFTVDGKELSVHEYLSTKSNIDVHFELEYSFMQNKITSLIYDIDDLRQKYQYMKNPQLIFNHKITFQTLIKLKKLVFVDENGVYFTHIPSSVKHLTANYIDFETPLSLISLNLRYRILGGKCDINIDHKTITNLEFNASNYHLPRLETMINLRHLTISRLLNCDLSLPKSLRTLSVDIIKGVLITCLPDIELSELSLKLNDCNYFRFSNHFVTILHIEYDRGYGRHCFLHFPNAKQITIKINNNKYDTNENDFIMHVLSQYTELDYVNIDMKYYTESKYINLAKLKIKKCDVSYQLNFISYYYSAVSVDLNKLHAHINCIVPKTTKTLFFGDHWPRNSLVYDLPHLEYLKFNLHHDDYDFSETFKNKKIDCIEVFYHYFCDFSMYECNTLICRNCEYKYCFEPPLKYRTLKLYNSVLHPILIHQDLEIIFMDKKTVIKEKRDLMNVKQIHCPINHDLSLLTYKETCIITYHH